MQSGTRAGTYRVCKVVTRSPRDPPCSPGQELACKLYHGWWNMYNSVDVLVTDETGERRPEVQNMGDGEGQAWENGKGEGFFFLRICKFRFLSFCRLDPKKTEEKNSSHSLTLWKVETHYYDNRFLNRPEYRYPNQESSHSGHHGGTMLMTRCRCSVLRVGSQGFPSS